MSSHSLDSLSSGGVIDFDADAFVKGTTPRFVGNPEGNISLPFEQPLIPQQYGIAPGEKLKGEPLKDAFISHEKEKSAPTLSEILTGGLVAALALFGGLKIHSILKGKKEATKAEKPAGAIKKFMESCKKKLSSFFNDKVEIKEKVEAKAKEVVEEVSKDKKGFFSKIFKSKGVKIAGIGALGLLALYGLYKVLPGNKHQSQEG